MKPIPLKQWFYSAAAIYGIPINTMFKRYYRNRRRFRLKLKRINARVVLVLNHADSLDAMRLGHPKIQPYHWRQP